MISLVWKQGEDYGYFYNETSVASGATSDFVKLEHDTQATVYIFPDNRAKVQFTGDDISVLAAGGGDWLDWPLGTVNRDDADTIVGVVSAVRLVSVNGAATMKVRAK